jgi:hypothetical protein
MYKIQRYRPSKIKKDFSSKITEAKRSYRGTMVNIKWPKSNEFNIAGDHKINQAVDMMYES